MEHLTDTAERVSTRVADHIKASGVTVIWLCETTGIPRTTLLRRLNGHSAFNLNELDRIAKALRISPADLLGQETAA